MRTHTLFLVLLAFLTTTLSAGDIKIIAFAQDDMANDFRKAQVKEASDEALRYPKVKFTYSDAQGKTSLLIYQIDAFIRQKVDLIILGTNDADAVVPVVSKAYKSGIPVIVLDRGINSKDYTTFINSDNLKIGVMGAKYLAEKLNKNGTVLLFEGLQTADVTQLRSKGFLNEMAKYPNIKIIKRTGNYLRRDALIEMEKLLKDDIRVDGIFSHSDSMLSGIRSTMSAHKKDPSSIVMIGCDYTKEAQNAIREGTQSASIKFPLGAKQAITYSREILEGKKLPKHIYIPVELVTLENIEKVEPIF